MFNKAYTHWSPFTIPPTPTIQSGSTDNYSLSCDAGADGTKNPSQFLKWKKTNLPRGSSKGDLLQWDPESGEEGAWIILAVPEDNGSMLYWTGNAWQFLEPPSGSTLNVLTIQNGNLSWTATQDCE